MNPTLQQQLQPPQAVLRAQIQQQLQPQGSTPGMPMQTPLTPQQGPQQGPPVRQQPVNVPNAPVRQVPPPDIKISPIAQGKLKDMYSKAADYKPLLDSVLKLTALKSRARPITNFKNPQTAVNKVDEKNQEDPSRNYQLQDVNDIVRGRLVYGSMDALRNGITDFKQNLKGSGASVVKTEDFFHHPEDGYEGYHVDVRLPNGLHSEIQFHTEQSYAASMATHNIHDQFGDMPPEQVKKQTQMTNQKVLALNPAEANVISTQKEAEVAPQQARAQQMAAQMILAAKQQGQSQMPQGPQVPQG